MAYRAEETVFVLHLTGWPLNCSLGEETLSSERRRRLRARGGGLRSWTVRLMEISLFIFESELPDLFLFSFCS